MTKFFLLMAALVTQGGAAKNLQIKFDGSPLVAADVLTTGTVNSRPDAIALDGGRIELSAARQKALDTQLAKPTTVVTTLIDHTGGNTTAMALGQLKLMKTDNIWFLVNLSEGKWRQIDLGKAAEASPLKLALVLDAKQASVYRDGKLVGSTPYEVAGAQKLTIGSPADEKTPWKGDVREFEILTKALKPEEIAQRANPTSTSGSGSTGTTAPSTKTTVVEAELVNLTEVPEPSAILPYKEALVTHEYKVISVKSGSITGVTAGATIRVARWGIISSKKTDIANLKKGARLTLTLDRVSDHPAIEHQYTVDNLPENFAAPYLLDVSVKGGASSGN